MRIPKVGDIWLVNYPYITPGNMEKIRPAIIKGFKEEDDTISVQKITTKCKKGFKKIEHPKLSKTRVSYISTDIVEIKEYRLLRYIGNLSQGKRVNKSEKNISTK